MRRALGGAILLSIGSCPIGVFLMLRRMSLTGDAMSHAILPGVAFGFLFFGLQILPMALGGMVAGIIVALVSGLVSRLTILKEDASLASLYLISLSIGVIIVSSHGSTIDLMHVLFGSVLALNNAALILIAEIVFITLVLLFIFWRGLVAECLDPLFFRSVSKLGGVIHLIFLILVVLNLVGGFLALGTLLSVGLMILPATSARFWSSRVEIIVAISVGIGICSCLSGLLLSYYASLATGPAIILSAGVIYVASIIFGPSGILFNSRFKLTQINNKLKRKIK